MESVCVSGSNVKEEHIEFGSTNVKLESLQLFKACRNAVNIAQNLIEDHNMSTITHKVRFYRYTQFHHTYPLKRERIPFKLNLD